MFAMRGLCEQAIADATTVVTRSTGALQSKFTAVKPRYIRLELVASTVALWAAGSSFKATVTGKQSNVKLVWSFTVPVTASFNCVHEFYPTVDFPLLFDEEIDIRLQSTSGQANSLSYTIYYDRFQSDEMTMVQTIEGY